MSLDFINPKHTVPLTRPWVTVLTDKESVWPNAFVLQDKVADLNNNLVPFPFDGWIVRDVTISQGTLGPKTTMTLLNPGIQFEGTYIQDADNTALNVRTKDELVNIELPIGAEAGQYAIVMNDEGHSGYIYRYKLLSTTPVNWDAGECIGIKYSTEYISQGRLSITKDDLGENNTHIRFNNTAMGWSEGIILTALPKVPRPYEVLALQVSTASVLAVGDIVTVVNNDGIIQCVGIFEGLDSTGKRLIRVLVSPYQYGGVRQYATFEDFPNPLTLIDDDEHFVYFDRSTAFAYTYDYTNKEYIQITPDLTPYAKKFTKEEVEYDLINVYNELTQSIADVAEALAIHKGTIVNAGTDAHITPAERTTWDQTTTDLGTHKADLNVHFDTNPDKDITLAKIRKEDLRLHLKDADKVAPSTATHHMRPTDWTTLSGAAQKTYVDEELAERDGRLDTIEQIIAGLEGLGRYLKSVDNYETAQELGNSTLLAITTAELLAEFPGVQVNDFMNIRFDETKSASARYILIALEDPNRQGYPKWQFDVLLNQDLTYLMDAFADGDYTIGWIPVIKSQHEIGNGIDPDTLSLKAELEAHENATTDEHHSIHVTDDLVNDLEKAIDDLDEHSIDAFGDKIPADNHLQGTERTDWTAAATLTNAHAHWPVTNAEIPNTAHVAPADRTNWDGKADQTALAAEIQARATGDNTLSGRIDLIANRGYYLGDVEEYPDLPTNKGANLWYVGDWMIVKTDVNNGGNTAIYRLSSINASTGALTWTFDFYWPNSALNTYLYRRQLSVLKNSMHCNEVPTDAEMAASPNSWFDIYLSEEQTTIRFILGRIGGNSSGKNINHLLKSAIEQRVMYQYFGHYWSSNNYTIQEDPTTPDGSAPAHDGGRWVRNFNISSGSANSRVNTWMTTEDSTGQPMGGGEAGQIIMNFPRTGNFYQLYIGDTCAYTIADNYALPYVQLTKGYAPSKLSDGDLIIVD
jgi:hypothetical protein